MPLFCRNTCEIRPFWVVCSHIAPLIAQIEPYAYAYIKDTLHKKGRDMATVRKEGEWCVVEVDGLGRGRFGEMIDANWYALALLREGLVTSVILSSGLEIR